MGEKEAKLKNQIYELENELTNTQQVTFSFYPKNREIGKIIMKTMRNISASTTVSFITRTCAVSGGV
jgi:hypothetical protein